LSELAYGVGKRQTHEVEFDSRKQPAPKKPAATRVSQKKTVPIAKGWDTASNLTNGNSKPTEILPLDDKDFVEF